jgi:hypothetical protein
MVQFAYLGPTMDIRENMVGAESVKKLCPTKSLILIYRDHRQNIWIHVPFWDGFGYIL